jgi:hypothetical protein
MKKFDPLKLIKDVSWVQPEDCEYRLASSISRKIKEKETRKSRKDQRGIKRMLFTDHSNIAS